MSLRHASDLSQVALLLAELASEIQALEARSGCIQALAQLNAREARGEPLTAVCGKTLRARLEAEVENHPATEGRRKLAEFTALFELRQKADAGASADAAVSPTPAGAVVIDMATHRERHNPGAKPARERDRLTPARTLLGAVALLAMASASLQYLPAFTRGTAIDLASYIPITASAVTHLVSVDGF